MAQEHFTLIYGNNAADYQLEAARLMSEALCHPDQAADLVELAMKLFEGRDVEAQSIC